MAKCKVHIEWTDDFGGGSSAGQHFEEIEHGTISRDLGICVGLSLERLTAAIDPVEVLAMALGQISCEETCSPEQHEFAKAAQSFLESKKASKGDCYFVRALRGQG